MEKMHNHQKDSAAIESPIEEGMARAIYNYPTNLSG
jgi:hypothetical protein